MRADFAADITDRFDFSFVFGDLNFRLDITRLHADWLISRKGIVMPELPMHRQIYDRARRLRASPRVRPTTSSDGPQQLVCRLQRGGHLVSTDIQVRRLQTLTTSVLQTAVPETSY